MYNLLIKVAHLIVLAMVASSSMAGSATCGLRRVSSSNHNYNLAVKRDTAMFVNMIPMIPALCMERGQHLQKYCIQISQNF